MEGKKCVKYEFANRRVSNEDLLIVLNLAYWLQRDDRDKKERGIIYKGKRQMSSAIAYNFEAFI